MGAHLCYAPGSNLRSTKFYFVCSINKLPDYIQTMKSVLYDTNLVISEINLTFLHVLWHY